MSGRCHYCPRPAAQNVVWLRNVLGGPARIVRPHCGCDFAKKLADEYPAAPPLKQGLDFVFEPLEGPPVRAEGDGATVTLFFRRGPDVYVAEGNDVVYVRMPKYMARKLADDTRKASHRPEPGCTDPTDHFHGHCGCK